MFLSLKLNINYDFIDEHIINNYRQKAELHGDKIIEVEINPIIPDILFEKQNIVNFCDNWYEFLKVISMLAESFDRKKPRANNVFEQILLEDLGGGCFGKCIEFQRLLQKYGIETRIVSGFLPYPEEIFEGYFGTRMTHFIVDVNIDGNWIEFDPSMKSIPTTFIRLSELEKGLKLRKNLILYKEKILFR